MDDIQQQELEKAINKAFDEHLIEVDNFNGAVFNSYRDEFIASVVKNLNLFGVSQRLKTNTVVFFELAEDNKYYDENGTEVTTELIIKHTHAIEDNRGYLILNGG